MTSAQKLQVGAGAVCAKARGVWATLRYCDIAHTQRATQRHKSCFEAPQGVPYIHISNAIVSHLIFIGPRWTSTMRAACFQFIFDFESRNEMKTAFIKAYKTCVQVFVCVCSLICLALGQNRQPHRIDFVNCSLFAFHSGLVELSAVISVIALPFSVNSPRRGPSCLPPPLLGELYVDYMLYI